MSDRPMQGDASCLPHWPLYLSKRNPTWRAAKNLANENLPLQAIT